MANEPDPREAKLPAWARESLARLRNQLSIAEACAEVAEKAAALAVERSRPDDVPVTYDGPDGQSYGLPGVTCVRVGDVEIELTERGVTVDATHRLIVEPVAGNTIRVRSVR